MKNRRPHLLLILLLYLAISLTYSIMNPLFEAPDEHLHYFTAQYIADTGRLPAVAPGDNYDEWLGQEAAQPPLYYLLGALIIAPLDTHGAREQVRFNPLSWIGNTSALANVNRFVYTPDEAWPWQGFALAAHLLRGLSVLFGAGTLLCIYGSGRYLWPTHENRALLSATLAAFLPQFGFVHGAISNDTLITFLSSLAIWQILRLWVTAVTPPRLLLLGITIGLAALTKNAGVLLLIYALGILILLAIRDWKPKTKNNLQSLVSNLLLVAIPVLLIAGWLWWRNWQLYGDWTAANQFIRIAGGDRKYTLWQVLAESDGLWLSLIAVFGWFNLSAPNWVYWIWSGMVILSLLGAVWSWKKNFRPQINADKRGFNLQSLIFILQKAWFPRLLLAGWVLAVYAGLVTFMMQTEAAQGRLLFPAIVPLTLGLAYGLSQLPGFGKRLVWLWPGLGLATTLYALFFVIRPAYALPATVTAVPPQTTPIQADLGQGLQLLASEVETATAVPGDILWFTLYWQTDAPPSESPQFVFELFGRGEAGELPVIAKLQSYHGRGLYSADLWSPGTIIADRFAVRLEETAAAPVLAHAFVKLAGETASAEVGSIKISPQEWPTPAGPVLAQLGDNIGLTAVSLSPTTASPGTEVQVTVQWLATAVPAADYTTLVHLALPNQPPLASGDRPPLNGQYPTHVWSTGEVIDDRYTLIVPDDLANGRYPVWIGMYDRQTLIRLPLTVDGVRQANDVYQIGWLTVESTGPNNTGLSE